MHTKNHPERQGLSQKTFSGNASAQQSIVKSISNSFLDLQ